LIEDEVAERYRMTAREVRQQIAAVDMMDNLYFPMIEDRSDPEHRTKFSYFLEFYKNGRIVQHSESMPDLPRRFCRWIRDGHINTGVRVRRLPKVLDSKEATRLLDAVGFDAAEDYLERERPGEQVLYALIERARGRLADMTVTELVELSESEERQEILRSLQEETGRVLESLSLLRKAS